MAKMTRLKIKRPKNNDQESINSKGFNFLEKFLVFRTLENLIAPKNPMDNRMYFRIDQFEGDLGICFLIHVDHKYVQLCGDEGQHPDYLSVYICKDMCICTIIELKIKSVKEAITQITRFKSRLKEEFARCLPSRLHPHIQGMIITTPNVQSPGILLKELPTKEQLTIRHHMQPNGSDICSFVSKRLQQSDILTSSKKPEVATVTNQRKATLFERLLRQGADQQPFKHSEYIKSGIDGITINYTINEGRAVLHITPNETHLQLFLFVNDDFKLQLDKEIKQAGLERKINIAILPPLTAKQ